MRIRLGVSPDIDRDSMGAAIDAALEATTRAQVPLLEKQVIPDIRSAIERGKVRWRPEPPGDEHFDDARTVLQRGWGDCDDLAPWLAASLRASGEDPGARAFVYPSGPRKWHAVVEDSMGRVLDPSKWAGMGRGVSGINAAAWNPMFEGCLGLAAHPFSLGWAGRVDLPDQAYPVAWSALSTGQTPAHAVVGAIRGACRIAEGVGSPSDIDMMRLCGLDHLLCGVDYDVVGDVLGDIGFLPALLPAAASLASPLISKILPGGKGGGAPAAPPPSSAIYRPPPGGGSGAGTTMSCPGGPIIIRF